MTSADCSIEGHTHSHGAAGGSRRLGLALLIIAGFAVVEVIGGAISGSLALLADAGHMVTDAAALALALSASWLAKRKPSDRFQFGLKRAQVLAAFVNGLGLLLVVVFLAVEAFERLGAEGEINAALMLSVAAVGLAANIAAFFILHPQAGSDVNVRGAMLHVAADIFGSVAAIVSALVIMATGFVAIDALLTLAVCALILKSTIPLLKETGAVLLQAAPDDVAPARVREVLTQGLPILDVHQVRSWQLTPGETMMALHAVIPQNAQADEVLAQIKEKLRREFGVAHSTVQLETTDVVSLGSRASARCVDDVGVAE